MRRELFGAKAISIRVSQLALVVAKAYATVTDDAPLTVLVVLNGAMMFAADLLRELAVPMLVDTVRVASYEGSKSTGEVTWLSAPPVNVAGQRVLIIEDIVDTGRTLAALIAAVEAFGAIEVRCIALLNKHGRRVAYGRRPDWWGWTIGEDFVVGYGLDLDGRFRELGSIIVLGEAQPAP